MIERGVFDTSTLVGAALKSGSKPHQALLHGLDWRGISILTPADFVAQFPH